MQQEFYTSCMKINGIPLLPPLMTDDVKEEMRRYRSLAVKVEENLRDRRLVECDIRDKWLEADVTVDKLRNIRYSSDSDVSSRDIVTSDTNNSDSHSKLTIVEPMIQDAGETKDGQDIQSSISDVQKDSQYQVCLPKDIVNDSQPIVAMIEENKCINVLEVATPNEDVTTENWKPEVPRTLDIVPITLSNDEEDTSSSIGVLKETENPPKLSRQNSYVLDTPSPVLLAHANMELIGENYIPTRTTTSQRKQWNIVQPKVEWENKQFMSDVEALDRLECIEKISAFQHSISDSSTESHQVKSTDTKATIVEEDAHKLDVTPTKHNHSSNTDLKKQSSSEKSEKDSDSGILNLSSRENPEDEKQLNRKEKIEENRDSNIKTKSSTPDKLLTIYKEIEEMHKKQMMELIHRQRKEQSLLQAEFQKQQMLLLTEIRKCASGVPRQGNESNATLNRSMSNDETRSVSHEMRQRSNINSPNSIRYNIKSTLANRVIVCPLDYFPSKNVYLLKRQSYTADNSPATLDVDFVKKLSLCDTAYYNNNNDNNNNGNNDVNSSYESRDLVVYKNSNVSRQLFPLDSNAKHVPVLDTVYQDKHVQAVNIINAYARGYLVRRLMKTERVITLKKVYKEALQCMLKLHVDAPLNSAEVDFLHRLQLQCDAASMNIVELFAQSPTNRMKVIAQDREIKESRAERPTSSRSYSFATQKTLARKNLKEFESTMAKYQRPFKRCLTRSRCQTWTSDMRDKLASPNTLHQGIRRSTSTGAVRKPWR
ncbi:hypothetical protein PUN28_003022 [Cardiocondyla obscurior]|uniref:Uncharacterized protein n=1 Tax=Cardiocondyla obscurior TaxID=286306 RepID=A0AAW2GXK2_9HYME